MAIGGGGRTVNPHRFAEEEYVHEVDTLGSPVEDRGSSRYRYFDASRRVLPRPEQLEGGYPPYLTDMMMRFLVV